MKREELKKLIVGPIATVPTPFDDDFEVDFGTMASATQFWVDSGLVAGKAVIKVDYDDMSKFARMFNVIDNSSQPVRCHKLGGRGYINLTSEVYPPHDP